MTKTPPSELRRAAEERCQQKPLSAGDLQEQDLRRLVAELQIHQCELEIQNEELIRARAEAENWLSQYTELYEFAPVSYFALSEDGTILRVNYTGTLLLGLERSKLTSRRFGVFLLERFRRTFSDFLARAVKSDATIGCEVILVGPYERPIYARIQAAATGDGKSCRIVVLDISDRKYAEDMAIARRKEEQARLVAEEANATKDRFLAMLSHELRTPLTPVLAAVTMLERRPGLDDQTRQTLQMARRNIELESRLIEDLLDLTRVTRGKLQLEKRRLDLCSSLAQAVDICRADFDNRGLDLRTDFASSPCIVEGDGARLEQVIWNLLKNAAKFTPRGGSVTLSCYRAGNHAIVQVRDTGIGIEPEALDRIFNVFEQGEQSITRQFGGLGLGLAICKTLVELHDGTIRAHSDGKGKGAQFTVRLPLSAVAAEPLPLAEDPSAENNEAAGPPLRLLLVEDHGDTADLLEAFFLSEGHRVKRAADVSTALELAGRERFDLLVSDLGLPDGSGTDLLRDLRARGHRMPAIVLSGYGQEKDLEKTKAAGFEAHLVKPVDLDRLKSTVSRAAASARADSPQ